MRVKKLVEKKKRDLTRNIETLTGKSIGLIDTMKRRVKVACLQKTKWKRDKAKDLSNGYKLYYVGKNNARNRVGIVLDNDLKEKVIKVKRLRD